MKKALFGIACAIGLSVGLGFSAPASASGPAKPNMSLMPSTSMVVLAQRKCKRASNYNQCLVYCRQCGGSDCVRYCSNNF